MNSEMEVCRAMSKFSCSPMYRKSCGYSVVIENDAPSPTACPVCGGAMVFVGGPLHPPGTVLVWDERRAD